LTVKFFISRQTRGANAKAEAAKHCAEVPRSKAIDSRTTSLEETNTLDANYKQLDWYGIGVVVVASLVAGFALSNHNQSCDEVV